MSRRDDARNRFLGYPTRAPLRPEIALADKGSHPLHSPDYACVTRSRSSPLVRLRRSPVARTIVEIRHIHRPNRENDVGPVPSESPYGLRRLLAIPPARGATV